MITITFGFVFIVNDLTINCYNFFQSIARQPCNQLALVHYGLNLKIAQITRLSGDAIIIVCDDPAINATVKLYTQHNMICHEIIWSFELGYLV